MNIEHRLKEYTEALGAYIIENTLKKLAHLELQKCKMKMEKVSSELAPFEKLFGKGSRNAWTEFRSGKLGDDGDVMEWMMIFENYLALEKQYQRLIKVGAI